MEDRELESGLREALGTSAVPSERVWAKLRKPEPRWMPSFAELSVAALVGVVTLAFLATPSTKPTSSANSVAQAPPTFETTFVASLRTKTTLR